MRVYLGFGLVSVSLMVVGAIGYIANIITLINHLSDPVNLLMVLRIIGIFAFPLGAILGLL